MTKRKAMFAAIGVQVLAIGVCAYTYLARTQTNRIALEETYTAALLILFATWVCVALWQMLELAKKRSLLGLVKAMPYSSPEPWALIIPLVGYGVVFLFFTF